MKKEAASTARGKQRPATQWYWADWLRAPEIRGISLESRGFWMDLLAIMHAGEPYGHLTIGGREIDVSTLARMVGTTPAKVRKLLAELEAHHVFSRTAEGVIYSRRMVRDEARRNALGDFGKLGGNPKLGVEYNRKGFIYAMERDSDGAIKIGISTAPTKRLYKVRQQYPDEAVDLLAQMPVEDMGAVEAELHAEFAQWADGEWFHLPDHLCLRLLTRLKANEGGEQKGKETPSSAVASASAVASSGKQTNNHFTSARDALSSKLGPDYASDLESFLRALRPDQQFRWVQLIDARLTGMHPPAVKPDQMGKALREFIANGDRPNWALFEAYIRRAQTPASTPPTQNGQSRRNPQAEARDKLARWAQEPEDAQVEAIEEPAHGD